MRISPVSNISSSKIQLKQTQKIQNNSINQTALPKVPFVPTNQYLAFLGGYTIDLAQTYEKLKEDEYPQDIRKMVQEELASPDTYKTLYDVHFEKYKGINDCFSLDELKEKYPEFRDVISAYDVDAKEESFIGVWQNDESDLFPIEEDLTLQLIKLYWGQGFSLNDLSRFIKENSSNSNATTKLYYAMTEKLNIPLMSRHYAPVLKLSNKEYNERFTSEMGAKLQEARERRLQKEEGEPVYIPRGPMSQAQRNNISEGLKEYYRENPEAVYAISKRQKEYYQNHPEKREELSEVLNYAWNSSYDGKNVRKELSKYLKKYHNHDISDDKLINPLNLTKEEKNALKAFWQYRPHNKARFSEAMKAGWENLKSIQEYFDGRCESGVKISMDIVPDALNEEIRKWAKENGKFVGDMSYGLCCAYLVDTDVNFKMVKRHLDKFDSVNKAFADIHPQQANRLATARQHTIIRFVEDLVSNSPNLPKSLREDEIKKMTFGGMLYTQLEKTPICTRSKSGAMIPLDGVGNSELVGLLGEIMKLALVTDSLDVSTYINKNLNEIYNDLGMIDFDELSKMFI